MPVKDERVVSCGFPGTGFLFVGYGTAMFFLKLRVDTVRVLILP